MKGCGCKDECFGKLKLDVVFQHRLNMAEFTKDQRDILILAKLDENSYSGDTVRGGKRECQRFIYKFDSVRVCEKVWRYCYYVGETTFKNLKRHYKENGVIPRQHGLKGRKPVNTYTFEVIEDVVQFLIRYADEKGLPMPAAPRGRDDHPPIYLPSSDTKAEVYDKYTESCQQSDPPRMAVAQVNMRRSHITLWKLAIQNVCVTQHLVRSVSCTGGVTLTLWHNCVMLSIKVQRSTLQGHTCLQMHQVMLKVHGLLWSSRHLPTERGRNSRGQRSGGRCW
ncbi:uncharacterized protein [Ptychodera flava]|uniref:uncharacterized protein isoform X4 n=1 Tax=Ptychodera flava TaxID=63121 RepID=UPI00396AAD16